VLREARDPNVRVFVVWEPVLVTDWHAPGAGAVGRVPDARVMQFWDPRRALSQEIRRAAQSNPAGVLGERRLHGPVVWDFVAIYPAGMRWGEAFPAAQFAGAPVVRAIDDFRRRLGANGLSRGGS